MTRRLANWSSPIWLTWSRKAPGRRGDEGHSELLEQSGDDLAAEETAAAHHEHLPAVLGLVHDVAVLVWHDDLQWFVASTVRGTNYMW